jgi:hypothetical protein
MTAIASHAECKPAAMLTRSQRVSRELDRASAGKHGVLMTGHTSDVLIASNGALVRQPEWLATWAAQTDRDLLVLDEQTVDGRPCSPERVPSRQVAVGGFRLGSSVLAFCVAMDRARGGWGAS